MIGAPSTNFTPDSKDSLRYLENILSRRVLYALLKLAIFTGFKSHMNSADEVVTKYCIS